MAEEVFLNFPFDRKYEPLFIALIAGITGLGLRPKCVLEIPDGGQGRLDRIRKLIEQTRFSVHELGWVKASTVTGKRLPRFNMPFELGLAAMLEASGRHQFFVLESVPHRLQLTLSDLNGVDPLVHRGDPRILLQRLRGTFRTPNAPPTIAQLDEIRRRLRAAARVYKTETEPDLFSADAFRALTATAVKLASELGAIGR